MIAFIQNALFLGQTYGTLFLYALAIVCGVGAILDWVGDYRKNKKRGKKK